MERFFELEIAYIVIGIFFWPLPPLSQQGILCQKVPLKKECLVYLPYLPL